jgi:hypothetical protein
MALSNGNGPRIEIKRLAVRTEIDGRGHVGCDAGRLSCDWRAGLRDIARSQAANMSKAAGKTLISAPTVQSLREQTMASIARPVM